MDLKVYEWATEAVAELLSQCVRSAYMAQALAVELEKALALGRPD